MSEAEQMGNRIRRAVVTGPTGAVGMALIEELAQKDIDVYAVCHRGSARNAQIRDAFDDGYPGKVRIVECDLDELDRLPDLVEEAAAEKAAGAVSAAKAESAAGQTVFYHLAWAGTTGAARNDEAMQQSNVEYSLAAVRAAQTLGCSLFVGAGSQAEYGLNPERKPLGPQSATEPFTEYGKAKLAAGIATRELCEKLKMGHVWVRILSVYGPYDGMQSMVMSTIDRMMHSISPKLTRGRQQWDYLYSTDAARALSAIAQTFPHECPQNEKGQDGRTPLSGIYCLGCGSTKPLMEYAMTIAEIVHRHLIADDDGECASCKARLGGSVDIEFGAVPYSENQIMYLCADISDLTKDTGWKPKVTFDEGIRRTLQWYLKNVKKDSR